MSMLVFIVWFDFHHYRINFEWSTTHLLNGKREQFDLCLGANITFDKRNISLHDLSVPLSKLNLKQSLRNRR